MWIFWLTGLNLSCFFCLLADKPHRGGFFWFSFALWSFNLLVSLHISIGFMLLYSAPHSVLNNSVPQLRAHDLLECATIYVPRLSDEWSAIDSCLRSSSVYNISSGRIPYLRSTVKYRMPPTAFVFMGLDNHSIFVTPEYQDLSDYEKALVLIHECAHIGLGAKDYAYRWEPEYLRLTESQHYQNADSFMDAVFYHCN